MNYSNLFVPVLEKLIQLLPDNAQNIALKANPKVGSALNHTHITAESIGNWREFSRQIPRLPGFDKEKHSEALRAFRDELKALENGVTDLIHNPSIAGTDLSKRYYRLRSAAEDEAKKLFDNAIPKSDIARPSNMVGKVRETTSVVFTNSVQVSPA